NLHIYKDLQMPTGGWVRVHVMASEPTEIEGLIQDARFIDANLMFDDMSIQQTNTSGMTPEEAFQQNWTHDADYVTITDAKIVTDYLFQNMVALNGAEISLERISEPEHTDVSGANDADGSIASRSSGNGGGDGGILPTTASNLLLPFAIGAVLVLLGGIVLLARKRMRAAEEYKK